VQAVVAVHRIEHLIDRVLGYGMAEHAGHLFLGRDQGLTALLVSG